MGTEARNGPARPRLVTTETSKYPELAADARAWEPHPGVSALDLVRGEIGAGGLLTGVATFAPGSEITLHTHNVEEAVTVIEGEAICEIDGQLYHLRPYETSYVPPGVPHRFYNEGDRPMTIHYAYAGVKVTRESVTKAGIGD